MHNNTMEPKLALAKIKTKARPLEEINVDKEHKKEESSLLATFVILEHQEGHLQESMNQGTTN